MLTLHKTVIVSHVCNVMWSKTHQFQCVWNVLWSKNNSFAWLKCIGMSVMSRNVFINIFFKIKNLLERNTILDKLKRFC
jgi:hypothetical protein